MIKNRGSGYSRTVTTSPDDVLDTLAMVRILYDDHAAAVLEFLQDIVNVKQSLGVFVRSPFQLLV